MQHEVLGELDQWIRPAGVKDGVRQIVNLLAHPLRREVLPLSSRRAVNNLAGHDS